MCRLRKGMVIMVKKGKWHFIRKKCSGMLAGALLLGLGFVFVLPVLILVSGSAADSVEWQERVRPLLLESEGYVGWRWIPDYPTLEHLKRLLFYSPAFLRLFWNSMGMTGMILLGQLVVGVPAAWAFAAFEYRGRGILFTLYVILMLLPFQVTMLSKYLVLKSLGLLNTRLAVVLPAMFSTFPVFLVYRSFAGIPGELLEAARMDGAGEGVIFFRIGVPLAQGGICSALVLSFLECWNMLEEPLAFLQDKSLWPLSLYLPEISLGQAGFACGAALITVALSLLVFSVFQDSLEQGIVASALKG